MGPLLGSAKIGGSVFELPPGQAVCPYHYEHTEEEWAIVLTGRPTLRHPGGEDELSEGDVVCFPEGPEGAHQLANRGSEPCRVLLLSTLAETAVTTYPDSGKVGVYRAGMEPLLVRERDGVDYYDGET